MRRMHGQVTPCHAGVHAKHGLRQIAWLRAGGLNVENLTSILVAVEDATSGIPVLNKAVRLARRFGAHVDLLMADPSQASQFAAHCVALRGDDVVSCSVPGHGGPLHEMILARVSSHVPDLVIKPPSGTHPLRRWALGANDWQLSRECPVPVMLAGQ